MPAVSLVNVHAAGGTIVGLLQSKFTVEGSYISVIGDSVQAHPPCPAVPVHCAPTMATGSAKFTIQGIPVCREGDTATCGHAANGLGRFDIA